MYRKIIKKLENKKVAIVGFGREGKSTYEFIRKYLSNQNVAILDKNINLTQNIPSLLEDKNIDLVLGDSYLESLDKYDVIIKSPGISLKDIELSKIKNKLTSEINLFLENSNCKTIGVTGTKGKSTTSSLIYQVIKDQGMDAYLCGNIGTPIFDYIDKFKKDSIVVVEMSAYHTEFIKKSPDIGIILNLFEEHLDFFGNKEKYYNSKLNMFKYFNENSYGIYSQDNKELKELVEKGNYVGKFIKVLSSKHIDNLDNNTIVCDEQFIYIKKENSLHKIYNVMDKRFLLGRHNLENIMFVLAVSNILNLDNKETVRTINNFKTLEHRMEFVGKFKNINFYNDSIATIPSATVNCIESIPNVDTLIFGGMDRGIDYSEFIDYLKKSNVENFICLPDTAHKLGKLLEKDGHVFLVDNMEQAVKKSYEVTKKNYSCILSPAASSYNRYKNFEERGNEFKKIVKEISSL